MIINFDRAFSERPAVRPIFDDDLRRIGRAYRRARADRRMLQPRYRVGNEWLPIYENYMGEFISALMEDSPDRLRDQLENLFRRPFSNGLHGLHFEMTERYMTPGRVIAHADMTAYAETLTQDLDRLLKSVPDLNLATVDTPIVGNPYGVEIDDHFHNGLIFLYFANKISLLVDVDRPRIVELGAGFGGLPWAIKTMMPSARYVDFDLPEVLAIASFYAISAFPAARIGLFGELDVADPDLDKFDFVFMPNFEIERFPENAADLCFNSYSLAEMASGPIENYVAHLCRIAKRFFFHVNHTTHCKVSSDLFPVNFQKFRLLHRAPSMWGKSRFRNPVVDEHEFIYAHRP